MSYARAAAGSGFEKLLCDARMVVNVVTGTTNDGLRPYPARLSCRPRWADLLRHDPASQVMQCVLYLSNLISLPRSCSRARFEMD